MAKMQMSTETPKTTASNLHKKVFDFCKRKFPLYTILQEYTIYVDNRGVKEHLFVDILIKEISLAIECNGEQHYKPNKFFFNGMKSFKESQDRDERKKEWLKNNGYALAIIRFDDKLNDENLNSKIEGALIDYYG